MVNGCDVGIGGFNLLGKSWIYLHIINKKLLKKFPNYSRVGMDAVCWLNFLNF